MKLAGWLTLALLALIWAIAIGTFGFLLSGILCLTIIGIPFGIATFIGTCAVAGGPLALTISKIKQV